MNGLLGEPQDVLQVMSKMSPGGLEDQLSDLLHLVQDALNRASVRHDGSVRQFRLDELSPIATALWFLFGCIAQEGLQGSFEGGAR